ncbi:MAG: alpha/beta hydrolase [Desulfobaccales bacterium]
MSAVKRNWVLSLLILALFLILPVAAARAQEIKTINTRPGVTLRFLLFRPAAAPKGVLVLFPGAEGANMFQVADGKVQLGKNFLVRTSPAFVKAGYAVAVVDAPSDQASGMSRGFRNSPEHVQDIAKLIDFLDAQGLKPIYLVGNSMGTLSVAYLGMELKDQRLKGLVLTSTVTNYVAGLRLQQITLPVLLVHHVEDGCKFCPFQEAVQLKNMISGSPQVDFVEVQGGDPPQSGPCNALSNHGFFGVEDQVVQVIADWAAGRSIPARVGR